MMSATLKIKTAEVFLPLLAPAPYKGAHGGRGSGKSHFFGELAVEDALRFPGDHGEGLRMVCIREVQKDLSQSSKLLIEDKIHKHKLGIGSGFKIWKDRIETPKDGLIIFKGMDDYTAESAKSLERFKRAWVDEAQTLSARSLSLLRPTIHRWDGAEIWASWNPTRKADAIDDFFRREDSGAPKGSIVVEANWRHNPFWNKAAEEERLLELERYPERYGHTYEGEYARAFEGAYFAKGLAQMRLEGRIMKMNPDPLLPIRAYFDIGGSGMKADLNSIWIVQTVGPQIRILDFIEGRGQTTDYYVGLMRDRGWKRAIIHLPHDGINANDVTGQRRVDFWRAAGFDAPEPTPNQGAGAAMQRIEAVRRILPNCYFNATKEVESGLDALGFYHERKDEVRNIGLGPQHDWSSNAADAFGLLAILYEAPYSPAQRQRYSSRRSSGGSWQSA